MTLNKELKVKTYQLAQAKVRSPLLCRITALFPFPKYIHSLPLVHGLFAQRMPRFIVIAGPAADFLLRPNLNLKMDKDAHEAIDDN
jgi:hypothetical protein